MLSSRNNGNGNGNIVLTDGAMADIEGSGTLMVRQYVDDVVRTSSPSQSSPLLGPQRNGNGSGSSTHSGSGSANGSSHSSFFGADANFSAGITPNTHTHTHTHRQRRHTRTRFNTLSSLYSTSSQYLSDMSILSTFFFFTTVSSTVYCLP